MCVSARSCMSCKAKANKNREVAIEGIKVDKFTDRYVAEIKKSDADVEATKWQTLYYMYVLKQKGIERKGMLQFVERNKGTSRTIELELDAKTEEELVIMLKELETYIHQERPDKAVEDKKCKRCAYYAYCFFKRWEGNTCLETSLLLQRDIYELQGHWEERITL